MSSLQRTSGLVSVVIGVYNSAKYVDEAMSSIAAQTYSPIELIVVDDGSTDGTDQAINACLQKENVRAWTLKNRFVHLRLPYNAGFSAAYTTGYFLAQGEFIATQAADDISHPERIAKQVAFMREHSEVGMVGTQISLFNDGDFQNQWQMNFVQFGWSNIAKTYYWGSHCVCHGTTLFRGEIFDRLGGLERFPEGRDTIAEDYYFINKYFKNGVHIENIPEILYYYRRYPQQRSQNGVW